MNVPEQDKLENQDESTLYNIDQVTGHVTPLEVPKPAAPKKQQRASKKEDTDASEGAGK